MGNFAMVPLTLATDNAEGHCCPSPIERGFNVKASSHSQAFAQHCLEEVFSQSYSPSYNRSEAGEDET